MDSRERLLAVLRHEEPDHVPLWSQCFGFAAPPHLSWERGGHPVPYWYSMRLEHDHTLPQPWDTEDDFARVERWLALGADDMLEAAPPWSCHPDVRIRDWQEAPAGAERYPVLCRTYETPAGMLRHFVRKTEEGAGPGWVIQPEHVALFEDFNVGRAVKNAVVDEQDVACLRYLLLDPTGKQVTAYRSRLTRVRAFAEEHRVLVQGWSAFGMDAVVQLCGVEGAVLMAMTQPDLFQELVDVIYGFDRRRTEFMLEVGGVDMVVQYGWYSGTSCLSPRLFTRFVLPHLRDLVNLAHQAGARFAYVLTQGVLTMADLLLASGIDLLYWVDPVQDTPDLGAVKAKLGGKIALAGGINSAVTLGRGSREEIRQAVHAAVRALGPGGGFVLSPSDAIFPDTPWSSVEAMLDAWREVRDYPMQVSPA